MTYVEKAKTKRKNAEDDTVEFYPNSPARLVYRSIALFGLPLIIVIGVRIASYSIPLVGICQCPLLVTYTLFLTVGHTLLSYYRLTVSPEGLRCFRFREEPRFVPWPNIQRLDLRTVFGVQTWTVHYHERLDPPDESQLLVLPGPGVPYGFKPLRWIDHEPDIEYFQSTPLGEAFRYYAPWLFEGESEVDDKKRKVGDDGIR
jgi:hypothetical protein